MEHHQHDGGRIESIEFNLQSVTGNNDAAASCKIRALGSAKAW